jgi:hypothetical protein
MHLPLPLFLGVATLASPTLAAIAVGSCWLLEDLFSGPQPGPAGPRFRGPYRDRSSYPDVTRIRPRRPDDGPGVPR